MGFFSCFGGHKWSGLRCERCGKTRKAVEVLCESPLYKCHICNVTGRRIQEIERAKAERAERLNVLLLDMDAQIMLFCKQCNTFTCSTCASGKLEKGEDDDDVHFKKCPRCKTSFNFHSAADEVEDPVAVLALVAQKSQ
jgi:hypothetical protein